MAEALATCDTVTTKKFVLRLEGFSWKEIELLCEVSAHAARQDSARRSTVSEGYSS